MYSARRSRDRSGRDTADCSRVGRLAVETDRPLVLVGVAELAELGHREADALVDDLAVDELDPSRLNVDRLQFGAGFEALDVTPPDEILPLGKAQPLAGNRARLRRRGGDGEICRLIELSMHWSSFACSFVSWTAGKSRRRHAPRRRRQTLDRASEVKLNLVGPDRLERLGQVIDLGDDGCAGHRAGERITSLTSASTLPPGSLIRYPSR